MPKNKTVLVVVLVIGLGLIYPVFAQEQSGVTVTDADSVFNTTTSYSSELVNTAQTVNLRVAIEYAKSNEYNDLVLLPTSLQDLVNMVNDRVAIEYAKTNKQKTLVSLPTSVQDLVNMVTDRVAIEYASSLVPFGIGPIPTGLQNLLTAVASRVWINYASSNRVTELNYPTNLPLPGSSCTFSGTIDLQGRDDNSGATITAGANSTTTDSAVDYALIVPAGTYDVTAEMDRFLDGERLQENCPSGGVNQLPDVTLLGGDTNDDCTINILDLAFMGARFGLNDGDGNFNAKADINADGTVNILDLTVAGANFMETCPVLWP